MKGKRVIYKVLMLVAWLLVGSGMIVLLAAANKKQGRQVCKGVVVSIKGVGEDFYVEESDILKLLNEKSPLVNKPVSEISLSRLETKLAKHQWIKEAQVYFDSRNVLHVVVKEREPIARVIATNGQSFYIDSAGHRLNLLDKMSVRLPVITNFTGAKKLQAKDSALLKDLISLIQIINSDPFLSAQLAQIDVAADGTLEALPAIGDHVIRLGNGDRMEEKLKNLVLFYEQVISKTGFNKYKMIDVQYAGQVIGIQKGQVSAIDSVQLKNNIEALMKQSEEALADSLAINSKTNVAAAAIAPAAQANTISVTQTPAPTKTLSNTPKPTAIKKQDPNALKTTQSNPPKKTVTKQDPLRKPKAVMQKRA